MILRKRVTGVFLATGVIVFGLLVTGCAPEGTTPSGGGLQPGEIGSEPQVLKGEPSDAVQKGAQHDVDEAPTEDFGGRQPIEVEKVHALPESFPVQDVHIPEDAVIDHAGERDNGSWFAVLTVTSLEQAQSSLEEILSDFTLDVDDSDGESIYREYTNPAFTVEALAFTEDGVTVLSLDVSPRE